ncbi:hypothetical protein BGW37DRAFT_58251 [Umbelopsis sp. PMI_123]|nr:hypothetical protein BGW37DRAFT_58251 [Umbelopsis sp. PMI_123]
MSMLVRSRPQLLRLACRTYSTSSTTSHRAGGFRGGLLAMIIGLGLVSSVASTYVIERGKDSQKKLLVAIEQLQQSTDQFKGYAQKIDGITNAYAYLMANAASSADVEALKKAQRTLIDTQYRELLDLKAHVAELGTVCPS